MREQIRRGAVPVPGVGDEAVWVGGQLFARSGRWLITMDAKQSPNLPDKRAAIAITRASLPNLPH
jgi:hypothetical protein